MGPALASLSIIGKPCPALASLSVIWRLCPALASLSIIWRPCNVKPGRRQVSKRQSTENTYRQSSE